jgi:hypothetical protein
VSISAAGVTELAAQDCGTAWIVLLTMTHPELPSTLRFSSDAVDTHSNGQTFQHFPFDLVLPDDVEGRTPQAQMRIDNTSQELVAMLRSLTTPPSLTIQIVRSADPNVIEREWSGLEWRSSTVDPAFITGTLTVEDMATEEFPYITFDGRFRALWP